MIKFDRKRINWDTVIFGSVIFALQLLFLPSTIEFRLLSIVAIGEVVKLNAGGFHPEIEFTTRDGKKVSFAGSTTNRTEVGDRIEVRYRIDEPRHAEVNQIFSLYGLHFVPAFIGLVFMIGGMFGMKPDEGKRSTTGDTK